MWALGGVSWAAGFGTELFRFAHQVIGSKTFRKVTPISDVEVEALKKQYAKVYSALESTTFVEGYLKELSFSRGGTFPCISKEIGLDSGLLKMDKEAALFFGGTEISHLKNNDSLNASILMLLSYGIGLFSPICRSLPATVFYLGMGNSVLRRGQSKSADDFILERATCGELLGALRVFEASKDLSVPKTIAGIVAKKIRALFIEPSLPCAERQEQVKKALKERFHFSDKGIEKELLDRRIEHIRYYLRLVGDSHVDKKQIDEWVTSHSEKRCVSYFNLSERPRRRGK
jgi:hypothetical protein